MATYSASYSNSCPCQHKKTFPLAYPFFSPTLAQVWEKVLGCKRGEEENDARALPPSSCQRPSDNHPFTMDVTSDNFPFALQQLGQLLPTADFAAIDCEFTGLATSDDPNESDAYHDLPRQRWARAQQAAQSFLPLQVGICLFTRQVVQMPQFGFEPHERWVANPFNFFLWPAEPKRFSVQSNSLTFLVNNGFDLNRCIHQGIGWLSHQVGGTQGEHSLIARFPLSPHSLPLRSRVSATVSPMILVSCGGLGGKRKQTSRVVKRAARNSRARLFALLPPKE
jgi:hypothetical protein